MYVVTTIESDGRSDKKHRRTVNRAQLLDLMNTWFEDEDQRTFIIEPKEDKG